MHTKKINGTLLVLAWPDTMVIKIDAWYDTPAKLFGFLKNDYYKAGHAAAILVNHKTGELKYFDFGRYHSPLGSGRVRDSDTDPDLALNFIANINDSKNIINIEEIILNINYIC